MLKGLEGRGNGKHDGEKAKWLGTKVEARGTDEAGEGTRPVSNRRGIRSDLLFTKTTPAAVKRRDWRKQGRGPVRKSLGSSRREATMGWTWRSG